jgi:hypothetical protein
MELSKYELTSVTALETFAKSAFCRMCCIEENKNEALSSLFHLINHQFEKYEISRGANMTSRNESPQTDIWNIH